MGKRPVVTQPALLPALARHVTAQKASLSGQSHEQLSHWGDRRATPERSDNASSHWNPAPRSFEANPARLVSLPRRPRFPNIPTIQNNASRWPLMPVNRSAESELGARNAGRQTAPSESTRVQRQEHPAKEQASTKLDPVSAAVGGFTVAELQDAVLTVFGEISASLSETLAAEASAVASTIFNRKSRIDSSRIAAAKVGEELATAQAELAKATADHDELAKHPTNYKKELGGQQPYDAALAKAKERYAAARKSVNEIAKRAIDANSAKIANESYVAPSMRAETRITLTMIVQNPGQYLGNAKGQQDFTGFSKMSVSDRLRNAKRWKIAREAVLALAAGTQNPDAYVQFRSNDGGKRTLRAGETRIGGNDFWK